jgi:hypothetical protein
MTCPLCGTSVKETGNVVIQPKKFSNTTKIPSSEQRVLQRILWQVASILLVSGIIATLIIDLAIHKTISWSVYPVIICLITLAYVSLLVWWRTQLAYQLLGGCIIALLFLFVLNLILPESDWATKIAMPILVAITFFALLLILTIRLAKTKGLNVLAYTCVAMAMLCLSIDGILSFYFNNSIRLQWSVIVSACLLPVTASLLFMHIRKKTNADFQKIFHT